VNSTYNSIKWSERSRTLADIREAFIFKSQAEARRVDWRARFLMSSEPAPMRFFFSGGCELTYAGRTLEYLGHCVYDTFITGVSSDPIVEFSVNKGENAQLFDPDVIVLSLAQLTKPWLMSATKHLDGVSFETQEEELGQILAGLRSAISNAKVVCARSKIVLITHPVFDTELFSTFEYANIPGAYTKRELYEKMNLGLYMVAREFAVEVINVNEVVAKFGFVDQATKYGRIRIGETNGGHLEQSGGEILAMTMIGLSDAVVVKQKKVKCCVLDLDNTMWTGVFREDGLDKIKDGLRRFHLQAAENLARRGILLAIVSKNDPDLVEKLPAIFGRRSQFWTNVVSVRINWSPKSANIIDIAKELNIGLNSIAFFDDQPYERAEVAENAPDVRVFTDADLLQVARFSPFVPASPLSVDAFNRAKYYKIDKTRQIAAPESYDKEQFEKFLISSKFVLDVEVAGHAHVNRVFELFDRTNQQNVTLKRLTREAIVESIDALNTKIYCCSLEDRHGEYGIIGAVLIKVDSRIAYIEELAFSCRAMGKGIEPAFIRRIARELADKIDTLCMKLVRTEKNRGMVSLIEGIGFTVDEADIASLNLGGALLLDDKWINWRAASEAAAN